MDLNQLYHDHQILLMRADAACGGASGRLHRSEAATIAHRIERIHRAAGAPALRNWEARNMNSDQQPNIRRTMSGTLSLRLQ